MMDNRKIIVAFYIAVGIVAWFLTRSIIQYVYLSFYQIRRLPGIALMREALPVAVGAISYVVLLRHPKASVFFDEVVAELKRVTWPNRTDVVRSTTVVIICIVIASIILASFDLVWGKLFSYLLKG